MEEDDLAAEIAKDPIHLESSDEESRYVHQSIHILPVYSFGFPRAIVFSIQYLFEQTILLSIYFHIE